MLSLHASKTYRVITIRAFKFPKWLKGFYQTAIWDFSYKATKEKSIYLTFDDGPHPNTTPWILDLLAKYNAKATFFCLGKNVQNEPELYQRILDEGHQVGNHTMHHLHGWRTKTKDYVQDVQLANDHIDSALFRPPYGKIKKKQLNQLKALGYKTIFWSHITYDFDPSYPSAKRMKKTNEAVFPGAILVFHDSEKAFAQVKNELPELMEEWDQLGYKFPIIETP